MAILTFTALISNNWGIKKLGRNWRRLMRLGYLAYALLIARAIVIEWDLWSLWRETGKGIPPPRLLVSIFALLVILFRGLMITSKLIKRREITPNKEKII